MPPANRALVHSSSLFQRAEKVQLHYWEIKSKMKSSYHLAGLLDLVKNTHPIPATEKGHSTSKAKAKNHLSQICDSNISCRADLALICLAKLHLDPDKTCCTWIGGQRAIHSRRKIDLESKFFTPKAASPKASLPRISGEALCPHLQGVSCISTKLAGDGSSYSTPLLSTYNLSEVSRASPTSRGRLFAEPAMRAHKQALSEKVIYQLDSSDARDLVWNHITSETLQAAQQWLKSHKPQPESQSE